MKYRLSRSYNTSKKFIPLFIILYLIIGQLPLQGTVLCYGSDGHLAIENANGNKRCGQPLEINNSKSDIGSLNKIGNQYVTRHCGPCVDILISENNSEKKVVSSNNLLSQITMHAFAAYVISPILPEENFNHTGLIQKSPEINSILDSLQTTILIC